MAGFIVTSYGFLETGNKFSLWLFVTRQYDPTFRHSPALPDNCKPVTALGRSHQRQPPRLPHAPLPKILVVVPGWGTARWRSAVRRASPSSRGKNPKAWHEVPPVFPTPRLLPLLHHGNIKPYLTHKCFLVLDKPGIFTEFYPLRQKSPLGSRPPPKILAVVFGVCHCSLTLA